MGVELDYSELIRPYETEPNGAVRTPAGQRAWLLRKGFTPHAIDAAMQATYAEIKEGKEFDSGDALDKYLYVSSQKISEEIQKAAVSVSQKQASRRMVRRRWRWRLEGAIVASASGAGAWLLIRLLS